MNENQRLILQIVTMGSTALVAIVAVIVAGLVARSKGSWWAVLGGLLVCGLTIVVAMEMFHSVNFFGVWGY